MAIRTNQLVNFKGEPYATVPQVEEKIKVVNDEVQKIKTQVTDNLLDKETGNLSAKYNPIKVLSTENKTGLPSVDIVDGETITQYYPDNDYSKIQFIGDCKVTYRNDGQIVIRIGDNLNSSNFATNDGQTTGVDNASISVANGQSGRLSDGTQVKAINSGNYTINTATSNALIHFENNENTSFEVVVNDDGVDKVYYFGPITGNGTYTAKLNNAEGATVEGVSMVVSNFGEETKTSEGATGYCGSVSFTIAASAIANGEASSIKVVSIKHNNGGEGEFIDDSLSENTRYYYTDTTTKPEITASSVTVTAGGSKVVSGVRYLTGATANYSVSFNNIATPVCVTDNVSFTANNGWAVSSTNLDASYNATSMTGTGTVNAGQFAQEDNTVTVSVKNINGSVTSTTTLADYSLLVDKNNTSDTALIAYFDKEDSANYPRLNSDLTTFDNEKSILTTSDLMLKDGALIYPTGNYVGYNTILGTDFTQPNYSTGLTTGARTWYRKFYEAGDKNGATLTFAASSAISATAFGSTLTVRIGKLDADGQVAGWYDATKKSTESDDGIATNVTSNSLTVDWGSYGASKYGIIVELGMSNSSHKINTLTVAFA